MFVLRRPPLAPHAGGLDPDVLRARGREWALRGHRRGSAIWLCLGHGLRRRAHDELDLDAVAHDPGERLRDQRAVPTLQPVLREAVGDGDPEAVLIDVDEHGVAQPGLEVRGRERYLELPEGSAPDLLRVHSSITALCVGCDGWRPERARAGRLRGAGTGSGGLWTCHPTGPSPSARSPLCGAVRRAEGPER